MGCGQRQAIFDSVSSTLQQKEAHSASTDPQSEVDGRAKTIKWCTDNKLQQLNVLTYSTRPTVARQRASIIQAGKFYDICTWVSAMQALIQCSKAVLSAFRAV